MSNSAQRFNSWMGGMEGNVPAIIVDGKVVNVNLVNWTVDVAATHDRKRYPDVQVGSPYMHWDSGEGMYVMPEVGAKCMLCMPSDSSPPFISSFVMPPENIDTATADAPKGTTSTGKDDPKTFRPTFSGGRPRIKPGDIWMRTRDDNFLILHRGGTLQIGANELAQRIFIPLGNYIMDISDNYRHHTQGGSIGWSLGEAPINNKYPTEYWQTFRVFANDKFADIRIKAGKVDDPIAGTLDEDVSLQQVMYEVVVAPQGFDAELGTVTDSKKLTQRFAFDKKGNALLCGTGDLSVRYRGNIFIHTDADVSIKAAGGFSMTGKSGGLVDGGSYLSLQGDVVKIGPANFPVAHVGSAVQVTLPFTPIPIPFSSPLTINGFVMNGEPTVLV